MDRYSSYHFVGSTAESLWNTNTVDYKNRANARTLSSRKTWSCVYGAFNLSNRTHARANKTCQGKLAEKKCVHCTHEQVVTKELVKGNLVVCGAFLLIIVF